MTLFESKLSRLAEKHWVKLGPGGQYVYGGGSGMGTSGPGTGRPITAGPQLQAPGGNPNNFLPLQRPTAGTPTNTAQLGQFSSPTASGQVAGAGRSGAYLPPAAGPNFGIADPGKQFQANQTPQQQALNLTSTGSPEDYYKNLGAVQSGQPGYKVTGNGVQSWGYDQTTFSGRTRPGALSQPGQNLTGGQYGYGNRSGAGNYRPYGAGGGYGGGGVGVGGNIPHGATSLGGGGVGAGIGGVGGSNVIGDQLQKDLDAANAANEARYQQALALSASGSQSQQDALKSAYGGIQSQIGANKSSQQGFLDSVLGKEQGLIGGLGSFQKEQNRRLLEQEKGSANQSLVGRGLGNSTVVDSIMRGLDTEGAFRNMAVDDANARLGLGVLGQYGALGADVNARNDTQGVNAQIGQAGLLNQVMGQGTAQQIGIIEARSDLPPDVQARLRLLSQPGALGPYGYGGGLGGGALGRDPFGGGGNGGNNGGGGNSPLEQYLQYLMGQQQGGGGTQQTLNNVGYWGPGGNGNGSGGGGNYGDPTVSGPRGDGSVTGILGTYNPTTGWTGGNAPPQGTGYGYDDSGNAIMTAPGYGGGAYGGGQKPPRGYYGEEPQQDQSGWYIFGADGRKFYWDGSQYGLAA